jgi:hypothetical protein
VDGGRRKEKKGYHMLSRRTQVKIGQISRSHMLMLSS